MSLNNKSIYYLLSFISLFMFASVSTVAAWQMSNSFLKENLQKTAYAIDSDAKAIVLYENTHVSLEPGSLEYRLVIHVHRIVKILNDEGTNQAIVQTDYVPAENSYIQDVKGETYNLENGTIQSTALNKDAVYKVKQDKWFGKKFTLPGVKKGSIIDYSYTVAYTFYNYKLPAWHITSDIPKLCSEYEYEMSSDFSFTILMQGPLDFAKYGTVRDEEMANARAYHVITKSLDTRYTELWGKRNIPAVVEEPVISCVENYTQRMDFQLAKINLFTSRQQTQYYEESFANWDDFNDFLWRSDMFGMQITRPNHFFDKVLDTLITKNMGERAKAKKIFDYVRSNFSIIDDRTLFYRDKFKVKNIFEAHRGTSVEINLLLTAMLHSAGLKASPLLLSTIGNPRASDVYPLLTRFNYVATAVKTDDGQYYLDASRKTNPFGMLPPYCYNGYARIINKKGSAVNLQPDERTDKNVFWAEISDINAQGYNIKIIEKRGLISSSITRGDSDDVTARLKKDVTNRWDTGITDFHVDNINDPDTSLVITYKIHKTGKNIGEYYIPADFFKLIGYNPFTSAKRRLPIEFPYREQDLYILSVHMPDNYEPADLPKSSLVKIDSDLVFKHIVDYEPDRKILMVKSNYLINKTKYSTDNYSIVKQFYEHAALAENSVITLNRN